MHISATGLLSWPGAKFWHGLLFHLRLTRICYKADSRFAPSQWETALLCNDVSHWLGANPESALCYICNISSPDLKRWRCRLTIMMCQSIPVVRLHDDFMQTFAALHDLREVIGHRHCGRASQRAWSFEFFLVMLAWTNCWTNSRVTDDYCATPWWCYANVCRITWPSWGHRSPPPWIRLTKGMCYGALNFFWWC